MRYQIFISCVTDDFKYTRNWLVQKLKNDIGFHCIVQEDLRGSVPFTQNTLISLANTIRNKSATMIHILGPRPGEIPSASVLEHFLESISEWRIFDKFQELRKNDLYKRLTYTQWEFWIANLFHKKVAIFFDGSENRNYKSNANRLKTPASWFSLLFGQTKKRNESKLIPLSTLDHLEMAKKAGGHPIKFHGDKNLLDEIKNGIIKSGAEDSIFVNARVSSSMPKSANYTLVVNEQYPTCFVFLLDQSRSMNEKITGSEKAKKQAVADLVNNALNNIVNVLTGAGGYRDSVFVSVIGYSGNKVGSAFLQSNSESAMPISKVVRMKIGAGASGGHDSRIRMRRWIEPKAQGLTPMLGALETAKQVVSDFLADHQVCLPPIVINITDGQATDSSGKLESISVLKNAAAELCSLKSTNGNVLLFNAYISSSPSKQVQFPNAIEMIADKYGRFIFEISSVVPKQFRDNWASKDKDSLILEGSRGFLCNANEAGLMNLIKLGTSSVIKNREI